MRSSTVSFFLKIHKVSGNIVSSDEDNENTHNTYLGAIIVSGEKGRVGNGWRETTREDRGCEEDAEARSWEGPKGPGDTHALSAHGP